MNICVLCVLFISGMTICDGSITEHLSEDIRGSILSKLQDVKTKFKKHEVYLEQELDYFENKLSAVEERDIFFNETLNAIQDQLVDVKTLDEMNRVSLLDIGDSKLKEVDERFKDTENALAFLLSNKDTNVSESFGKYISRNATTLNGQMLLHLEILPLNKGLMITKPDQSKGRRAFTLTPSASITPSTLSTGTDVNHVAFTVFISKDVFNLYNDLIVPFDDVIINECHGFDTATHIFTCPVSGLYLFESAFYSLHQNRLEVDIVRDGAVIFRLYSAGTYDYPLTPDQGFNSGITRCNKGDRVWARIYQFDSNSKIPSSKYSSFSGLLLWSS